MFELFVKLPLKIEFTEENLVIKRPGIGVSPLEWENYLGKPSDRNYKRDDLIQ